MKFEPEWTSPPGETIKRHMERFDISSEIMAEMLYLENEMLNELLVGDFRIGDELATNLEKILGGTKKFWKTRDEQYLSDLERLENVISRDPIETWLNELPLNDLRNRGFIGPKKKGCSPLEEVYKFFECSDYFQWNEKYKDGLGAAVAFCRSTTFKSNLPSTIAWLRIGEIQASKIKLAKFDKFRFEDNLTSIKKLTFRKRPEVFFPILQEKCAKLGVAVVSSRLLEGCRASGASWNTISGNPVIMLSFRFLSEDHFWHTFFHEAGHVILHNETHIDIDRDDPSPFYENNKENEANKFAQNILIPYDMQSDFKKLRNNKRQIVKFSKQVEITPGIVVGQLQKHKYLTFSQMNHLKRKYKWRENYEIPYFYQRK